MKHAFHCDKTSPLDRGEKQTHISQLNLQGVCAVVCEQCGEVIHRSRRSQRRLAETQRSRRARHPSDGAMRKAGWKEGDWKR